MLPIHAPSKRKAPSFRALYSADCITATAEIPPNEVFGRDNLARHAVQTVVGIRDRIAGAGDALARAAVRGTQSPTAVINKILVRSAREDRADQAVEAGVGKGRGVRAAVGVLHARLLAVQGVGVDGVVLLEVGVVGALFLWHRVRRAIRVGRRVVNKMRLV